MNSWKGHGDVARDFAVSPLNVYWEVTTACDLACRHCRAEAIAEAPPGELTTAEGLALIDQIASFPEPRPNVVFTGGDPLKRADLLTLIDAAVQRKLSLAITPSATPRLTRAALEQVHAHGVEALGLSLDGSTAAIHDGIRGVDGCYARTLEAGRWGREFGMLLQVNTVVAADTKDDLPRVFDVVSKLGATRWSLFFLVEVGRGTRLQPVSAAQAEEILGWLADLAPNAGMLLATTEAPFYRRVIAERARAVAGAGARPMMEALAKRAVRDGHGVVFVSSRGDICPSGFLPLGAGNVRTQSIVDVYRDSALFKRLHVADSFEGRCGACGYRTICGGSRARAFAATGNPFESDPACAYDPHAAAQPHGPPAG